MPGRQLHQLAMRLGLRADLDEIELLLPLEELGRVGVDACAAETSSPARSSRSRSGSQSATSLASGTRGQASRWNRDTYPQPINAPRSGGAGISHDRCLAVRSCFTTPMTWLSVHTTVRDCLEPAMLYRRGC